MRTLTLNSVHCALSAMTGIPVNELIDPESLLARLPDVRAKLTSNLVGQNEAVDLVIESLRSRLLRKESTTPLLSVLCVGPSGVGKTELAKLVSRHVLGSDEALVRLDGSEFSEAHSVAKLIGAPPGYVGHAPGMLTEAVRRRPRTVVLFDEVEKASPEVRALLLQIMSAGRLTDSAGVTVDFRRAIVFLTSNLGNDGAAGVPDVNSYSRAVMSAVREKLPVELVGRLRPVVFRRLTKDDVREILKLKIAAHAKALRHVEAFEVSAEALEALVEESWSAEYGARQAEHVLASKVDAGVLGLLNAGSLSDIPRVVTVSLMGRSFRFGVR